MRAALAFALYFVVLAPFTRFLLHLLSPFLGDKMKAFVKGKDLREFRFSEPRKDFQKNPPLWIHAASGEIEYAKPLIRKLQETHPTLPLIVTYSSPSAVPLLQKIEGLAAWGPAPWEASWDYRDFLSRFKPQALVIARTDLWPLMAWSCAKAKVPMMMFAATFAANSSRTRGFSRLLNQFALSKLDHLAVVSESDREVASGLVSAPKISIEGDTRFDQVTHRLSQARPLPFAFPRPKGAKILVAGSTWPEDELQVLSAFARVQDWRLILVPHEVDEAHLAQVETLLQKNGLSFQRSSLAQTWDQQVLLVDQMGFLAEIYTWGDLAFVGGSFRKQVHSVMEPLACGLQVLVGPFHHNNREALEFQKLQHDGFSFVQSVHTADEIRGALQKASPHLKPQIQAEVRRRQGATAAALRWVESLSLKH